MFPAPREVLKAKDGSLGATPFALLLHAIAVEEKSCTLELKLRNLEKRLSFEEGVPVACESNLLHESLGHTLVEKGKLTAAQHHALLAECAAQQKDLGALLVEKQVLSPFDLFKHLQATLAHRILSVFHWTDAAWKFAPPHEVAAPIRTNTARLVYTGVGQMPAEAVAKHFAPPPALALTLDPDGPSPQEELKLSPKELRLIKELKARPTVQHLLGLNGFTPDEVSRRLFALVVLGMVSPAEQVDARPKRSSPSRPPSAVQPAPTPSAGSPKPTGLPFLDDDEPAKQLLAAEFLTHRTKDPFDLLGVPLTFDGVALQRAFVAKASALPPVRFAQPDGRQKAEALLVAYAKAFGALAEHESYLLQRKRREVADAQKKGAGPDPNRAAEQMKIRTQLLDADSQFQAGLERLKTGNLRGAIEHFEYACDIEPKGRFLAYLAYTRFKDSPAGQGAKALAELTQACDVAPDCEEAWVFRAEVATGLGRHDDAEAAWRRASKLAPGKSRYVDGIKQAAAAKTGARR